MALAVKAAGHGFLLRVFTDLGGLHGMIVIIAATGDALHILSAQLTLATAALAAVLHAGLRILFPGALQPLGAIKPTAGVLGVHLRLVSLGTSIQSVGKGCVYSVVY